MNNHRLHILIPLGYIFPSGVRRALDYKPFLSRSGWTCHSVSYGSSNIYWFLQYFSNIKRKILQAASKNSGLKWCYVFVSPIVMALALIGIVIRSGVCFISKVYGTLKLIYFLMISRYADVVLIQQIAPPLWFTCFLAWMNKNIIYDIDDAVFLLQPKQAIAIAKAAAVATPGSHFNAEFCHTYCRKVVFLPTPVPFEEIELPSSMIDKSARISFRIGWVGSVNTAKYLDVVIEPLRKLGSRYSHRIELVIVGIGNRKDLVPSIDSVSVKVIPWVMPNKIQEIVASFDAGIMPLHDTEWEKGKCGLKALEYMAAGVPAICSGVGENAYIINDGVNGFLANTPDEWVDKLERLLLEPHLRHRIGAEGRDTVQQRYSTDVCFEILLRKVLEPMIGPPAKMAEEYKQCRNL